MRACQKCLVEKKESEFYSCKKRKNPYCKKCFNKYCIERWSQRRVDAVAYKGGKCIKCGYDKNIAALDMHHRDPNEKEFVWNKLRLRNWDSVIKELDKCDLVCRNCHAEIHNPSWQKAT
jgi:hypothetical protein